MDASAALRALASLSTTSPEYGPGFTDHAAMVVEALERLDPGSIAPFVDRYVPRLRPLSQEPDEALRGFAAKVAQERAALARDGVVRVLSERTRSVLAPGIAGAAFHGVIRVAHAVRALERDASPGRLDELARGLAYSALRAEALAPATPPRPGEPGLSLPEALAALPPGAEALVHAPGMITGTLLARAAAHPTLSAVSGRLSLPPGPAHAASALRRAAIALLTEGEFHPDNLFTLLHGVTGMDAVCAIVRRVDAGAARALVASAGGALLALRVGYIGHLGATPIPQEKGDFSGLRARAIRSLDDHAIKLAAALDEAEREHADPRNAAALGRWLDQIGA
jgi:hypothetical protein